MTLGERDALIACLLTLACEKLHAASDAELLAMAEAEGYEPTMTPACGPDGEPVRWGGRDVP
jgi:hypothetical protein